MYDGSETCASISYRDGGIVKDRAPVRCARHDDSKSISNLSDMTVVTAVSAGKYIEKLRHNLPLWMKMDNLGSQNFIVFSVNMDLHDMTLDFAREYPNVKVLPWFYQGIGPRENAFSAFVFGTAQYVQTDYWMKLDADATPIVGVFDWPEYKPYMVVSSPWGYTYSKGVPDPKAHVLNQLDDWYRQRVDPAAEPLFPLIPDPMTRFRHKRIASFCCIERTEVTRELARLCTVDGVEKLPVPSHDTTVGYFVLRKYGEAAIKKVRFKRYFRP